MVTKINEASKKSNKLLFYIILKEEYKDSTVAKFATIQKEGTRDVTRDNEYYNLDVIISVGYRVKSQVGIEFRKWATKVLKDY